MSQAHLRNNDTTATAFFEHSSAQRINTQAVIAAALKHQYPSLDQIMVTADNCNLLDFASSTSLARCEAIHDEPFIVSKVPATLSLTRFQTAAHRTQPGTLSERIMLGKYSYRWADQEFLIYLVDGRDGSGIYPQLETFYILTSNKPKAQALVHAVGTWTNELHDEVWEFDGGYWQKNKALYESVQKASWENVILDAGKKKTIIDDHLSFFNSHGTYDKLQVPWKRGIIYYGPPGNGKTISIKAMMHTLYSLKEPIPTLYVRSLASFGGPEYAIKQIFDKARAMAPCYLILEDLDTIISDNVRSYFLNEVDGLKANDGIFMLGSTNHLDRLDPGIAQRPSRFDRKYFFDNPNTQERIAYCQFWQRKLKDNEEIAFPDRLCQAIARITHGFSFAYMQEAFVAALLAIARKSNEQKDGGTLSPDGMDEDWIGIISDDDEELDKFVLWKEIKKQIEVLRKGLEKGGD